MTRLASYSTEPREIDEDDRREAIDERRARAATRCQCAGANDWPGHCPGPANCPLCADDEETAL